MRQLAGVELMMMMLGLTARTFRRLFGCGPVGLGLRLTLTLIRLNSEQMMFGSSVSIWPLATVLDSR